jgi:predicted CopG family antitoxin
MTSTMTPSERRRAYKLKRIVISEHNYLALKKLGQAGDSFNDVISNLLRIQRNHQQEKGEKKLQEQQQPQQQQQQQKSGEYDDDNSIYNVLNDLYPSSFFDEALGHHRQQTE